MKKLLTLVALCVTSGAMAAPPPLDPDWTVETDNGLIYTLLPKTVKFVGGDTPFVTVVGEYYKNKDASPIRFRSSVTGCTDGSGIVLFTTLGNGEVIVKKEWTEGGGRVYDTLAMGTCVALAMKHKGELSSSRPAPKAARDNSSI